MAVGSKRAMNTSKLCGASELSVSEPELTTRAVDESRDSVAQRGEKEAPFPIVGIGASAGGLAAFEAFFSGMPADSDSGMAFVLVQHLAPDHKSILTELVNRYTRMDVFEVEDGMEVKPNCAYIIPPNRDMAFLNGTLQLLEPVAPRGRRLPIDFFFRSLAQDQRERAICVVLSGAGSDGTQGVKAIKAEGGMVMAQSPESTEHDAMPRSAIATGLVDYTLPPAEMPSQLIAYARSGLGQNRPSLVSGMKAPSGLKKVFVLLREQTGHDFSQYKESTILRRVERRMAVHQIEQLESYLRYLQETPSEIEALFQDLLIGVTRFFRDPQAFAAIQQRMSGILEKKASGSAVRVWVPGCSSGEEAYSLAIALREQLDETKQNLKLQVFATDIDSRAIDAARAGSCRRGGRLRRPRAPPSVPGTRGAVEAPRARGGTPGRAAALSWRGVRGRGLGWGCANDRGGRRRLG
jgi:two-component system CheB/CheR fusion protein